MLLVTFTWGCLRLIPLFNAMLRRCVGPRLTEKQRQTKYMGIRPLADPLEFRYAWNMSKGSVLYITILLVGIRACAICGC
jgi:hypothetical protein